MAEINPSRVWNNYFGMQTSFRYLISLRLMAYLFPDNIQYPAYEYDYVVVGAGAAGCVIASRLVDAGKSVLLIEAGSEIPLESMYPMYAEYLELSLYDWKIKTRKEQYSYTQHGDTLTVSIGKVLGGSTCIGHMLYVHPFSEILDSWSEIVEDQGWLYENIAPLLRRNENVLDKKILSSPKDLIHHGTSGPTKLRRMNHPVTTKYLRRLSKTNGKLILDINFRNYLGFTSPLLTWGKKLRQNAAYCYLRHLRNNRLLHLALNTEARYIIFDWSRKAIGVQLLFRIGNTRYDRPVYVKKDVILTAGAIKTPQLLMVSGVGPKSILEKQRLYVNSNVPVGENLQDHPSCLLVFKLQTSRGYYPENYNPYEIDYPMIHGYVSLNVTQTKSPNYSIRAYIFSDLNKFVRFCIVTLSFHFNICETFVQVARYDELLVVVNSLVRPTSRGRVEISSYDPGYDPVIYLNFHGNQEDLNMHVESVIHFNRFLQGQYFKDLQVVHIDPRLEHCGRLNASNVTYWKCYVPRMSTTLNNFAGTCAMGSVVDKDLFVRGVSSLRVADASIIPTIVPSPIMATVLLIAQRASDIILGEYKKEEGQEIHEKE